MDKVNLNSKIIYVWDCPICGYEIQENPDYVSSGDRVQCTVCGKIFEVGELNKL